MEKDLANEVADRDGNKDSAGSVRRNGEKKKVHWKQHTPGERQRIDCMDV